MTTRKIPIEKLIGKLHAPSNRVGWVSDSSKAGYALYQRGEEGKGPLLDALRAKDDQVLRAGAMYVGYFGAEAGSNVEQALLLTALRDGADIVRSAAAESLRKAGPNNDSSLNELFARLCASEPGQVRGLVDRLGTKDRALRSGLRAALKSIGSDAVGPLLEGVNLEDPSIRLQCIRILGEIGEQASDAAPELGRIALQSDLARFRRGAYEALLKIGPAADRFLLRLLGMRCRGYGFVHAASIVQPRLVPMIIDMLESDDGLDLLAASEALRYLSPEAIPAVLGFIEKHYGHPSAVAVGIFAIRGHLALGDEPLEFLVDMLGPVQLHHRFAVESVLGTVRDYSPFQGLEGDTEYVALLKSYLRSEDLHELLAGIFGFGFLATQEGDAAPLVAQRLQDKREGVRSAAVVALGRMNPSSPKVIEQMVSLLEDEDDFVQQCAIAALRLIEAESGTDLPRA